MLTRSLGHGMLAGAAGTTALNAATYADMALRGRGSSPLPQQAVETMTHKAGQEIPGDGEIRQHRLEGLGSLSGLATGVGLGAAAGLLGPVLRRLPFGMSAVLLAAAAMAGTDAPMARMGLTDPRSWSSADWLADAVPHLAYGVVTAWALRSFGRH
jgi:hypothetical protein